MQRPDGFWVDRERNQNRYGYRSWSDPGRWFNIGSLHLEDLASPSAADIFSFSARIAVRIHLPTIVSVEGGCMNVRWGGLRFFGGGDLAPIPVPQHRSPLMISWPPDIVVVARRGTRTVRVLVLQARCRCARLRPRSSREGGRRGGHDA